MICNDRKPPVSIAIRYGKKYQYIKVVDENLYKEKTEKEESC
jgi:hypothetical protein